MNINFEVNEQLINETEITLTDLNCELWAMHKGAYGDVSNEVSILAKVLAGEEVLQEQFEIAMENLGETLSHQMSFYNASYLALPYMLKVLEKKIEENDFQWQLQMFSSLGMIIMCDVPRNHYKKSVDEAIVENYNNCIKVIAELEKKFIMEHLDEIKELDNNAKSYLYVTALAVLGDREAAFVLTSFMFNEIYVACGACEEYNEEMPMISDGEIEEIEPAESVIGKWDGQSFDDTYVW